MHNLYKYYYENAQEAFNAMKENGLEKIKFSDDIEHPVILLCDINGYVFEAFVKGAKIINDQLVLIIEGANKKEGDYWLNEIPYLSAQWAFETIVEVVNEYLISKESREVTE